MSRFLDGPAAGTELMLRRAPAYLRVVVSPSGAVDALDGLEDEPREGEEIHVYRRVSSAHHVCIRPGGCFEVADYEHVPEAPALPETAAWRAWASQQPLDRVP